MRSAPISLIAVVLAAAVLIAIGTFYHFAANLVMRPFSDDPAMRRLGAAMLATLAPFMFLDGVQVVIVYALRSMGDQVVTSAIGIVAFFGVTGGLGWMLVRGGIGPMGLIYAAGSGMAVAAVLQSARLAVVSPRLRKRSSG